MKKQKVSWIIALVAFTLTFYWVEFSPWSSQAVASYNNGYGTFDMKQYHVEDVTAVLGTMQKEGFTAYNRYLVGDSLFIVPYDFLLALFMNT